MTPHRVVIATDIPYWLNANGAQQRMSALWRMFQREPFEALVFFLGSSNQAAVYAARAKGIPILPFKAQSSANLIGAAIAKIRRLGSKNQAKADGKTDSPLTLQDYRWPAAERQFRDLLRQFNPQTIVLEYVTMAYLATVTRSTVPEARIVLDSHDVLHRRCAQFTAAGYRHWLQINEQEEIEAARRFDVILAIQEVEADWFRRAAPQAIVLPVGHSFDFSKIKPKWYTSPERKFVVGYLGSNNGSNIDAITAFVKLAWPKIVAANKSVELLIGGTIVDAESVGQCSAEPHVRLQRNFASLDAFYGEVDLVINPVRFGTGLKIKTVEALAHGRPVITTSAGRIGIPSSFEETCVAVEQIEEMSEPIVARLSDPTTLLDMSRRTFEMARTEFSDERILGEFRRLLLEEAAPSLTNAPAKG